MNLEEQLLQKISVQQLYLNDRDRMIGRSEMIISMLMPYIPSERPDLAAMCTDHLAATERMYNPPESEHE